MTEKFVVTGMTCAACAAHVEKAANSLDGVDSAAVNLMLGTLVCSYDADKVTPQAIISAVEASGYGAAPADEAKRDIRREQEASARAMGRRLLWSVVCLVPLFYLSMGHMMGLPVPAFMHRQPLTAALVQLVLCVPILILNRAYFTVGFSRLFKGAPNMDSLVALGAAAGLVYSLIEMGLLAAGQVTGMPDLYFESAGMILTLVTVGKYLEERSKGKTTGAITALLALAPDVAVVRRSGTEVTVATDQIKAGETVIVRQGGRIPVDGTVVKGSGSVDESALTGESMPVEKTAGSKAAQFLSVPLESIGTAMTTYASQNMGAHDLKRVDRGVNTALGIGCVYSVASFLILRVLDVPLISLFLESSEVEIMANARSFIFWNSVFYIPLAVLIIYRYTIQGLGYSGLAMFAGVAEMVARAMVGFWFVPLWGYFAACIANPVAWFFACFFLIPAYFAVRNRLMKENAYGVGD